MEHPHQPPPVVTLHEPGDPHGQDVLEGGADRPSWPRRRVAWAAAALVVLGGLAAGGAEVQERRSAAADERRAAAAVELVLLPGSSGSSSPEPGGGALTVLLSLRNDGPREVEVAGASWAGFALVRPVRARAGEEVSLPFRQQVECPPGAPPPPMAVEDDLLLQVRTASTVRTVALLPRAVVFDAAEPGRMCGYYPAAERLEVVEGAPQARRDDALVLPLDLIVRGRAPAAVLALEAGPGLVAVLRDPASGAPVPLPTALLPGRIGDPPELMPYEVEVRVSDCVLARAAAGRELLLRNGDETDVAEHSLPYEPALLADLVATGCPG